MNNLDRIYKCNTVTELYRWENAWFAVGQGLSWYYFERKLN